MAKVYGPADWADLQIYQGDDWAALVEVFNSDGTPADLAGFSARAQLRRAPADTDPEIAIELTCAVSASAVSLSLTHDQTFDLCGRYMWDLELTGGAGTVVTILAGNAVVTAEVTREPAVLLSGSHS